MWALRNYNLVYNFVYDIVACYVCGLGLVCNANPVAQDIVRHGAYVFGDNVSAAFQESVCPAGVCKVD